jgi:hypothetical protein
MIEAEAIIVSLVFEHALRIRIKAETPNPTPGSTSTSTPSETSAGGGTPSQKTAPPPDSSNLIGKINNLIATDAITAANKGKDILRIVIYAPCSFLLGTYFLYSILVRHIRLFLPFSPLSGWVLIRAGGASTRIHDFILLFGGEVNILSPNVAPSSAWGSWLFLRPYRAWSPN